MNQKLIKVKEFSRYPYGRERKLFKSGGEIFREDHLLPALKLCDSIIIDLDGTEGYGSSFLDEAFANLVRKDGFKKEEIKQRLEFISKEDPTLIDEIIEYIDEA